MADEATTETATLSAIPSTVASAVATPASMPPMDPEERQKSIMVSLADLTAKATALYAQKKYEEAAEIYAQASEMQAEFNGEMSPENANILFLYGRSLFKVGQSKSDVLGGKAPANEKKTAKKASGASAKQHSDGKATEQPTEADKIAEEGVAIVAKNASGSGLKEEDEVSGAKKPLFKFTGDENFEDSDEEDGEPADGEAEGENEEEEEDDDDLAIAFEILDLSRILFEKKLEESSAANGEGTETIEADPVATKHVKERLADIHDLLAEISLENEK
jgi:HAT1-interacting factor 1